MHVSLLIWVRMQTMRQPCAVQITYEPDGTHRVRQKDRRAGLRDRPKLHAGAGSSVAHRRRVRLA